MSYRVYRGDDSDLPPFPDHFQVAKYSIFEKVKLLCAVAPAAPTLHQRGNLNLQAHSNSWCVLELQSLRVEEGRKYRVVRSWKDDVGAEVRPFLPFHPRVAMSTCSLSSFFPAVIQTSAIIM